MLEVEVKDEGIQRQTVRAPKEIIIANFIQLAKQIKNDPRTIRMKLSRPVIIWDPFEQKQNVIDHVIELWNRD
jgi:hypothetical protein